MTNDNSEEKRLDSMELAPCAGLSNDRGSALCGYRDTEVNGRKGEWVNGGV